MNKILRIGYNRYYSDVVFAEHLKFIKKNIDFIDGIVLFAEFSHYGYWPLEYCAENAALLKKRICDYREIGVKRIGINLLCLLGHVEEGWEVLPKAPFQYMVNFDGKESKSCLCPSNDEFLDYVSKRLAIYADAGADEVWLDDDLRLTGHGVAEDFCYCPKCISRFNSENGTDFTRGELISALSKDNGIKDAWDKFKNDVMLRIFTAAKKGVRSVSKDIKIGFMACDLDFKTEWLTASDSSIARPGGGFWSDDVPTGVFNKIFKVQRQIKLFPPSLSDIQYEYEAFPYEWLQRSNKISELESALALISGCNGVLYSADIFNDKQSLMDMIEKNTKKWDTLTYVCAGCKPMGVFCISDQNAKYLGELSIPTTPYLENACAAMVLGEEWNNLSEEKIIKILDKNVLTDGKGLEILEGKGFGEYLGGRVAAKKNSGMAQRFDDDPLNGSYKNYYRDVFMNFAYGISSVAYELSPEKDAKAVAYLEKITHTSAGVSAYKYEKNTRRFVCDGYLFLDRAKTNAKRQQLINIFDWLSYGKLPIKVNNEVKVIPIAVSDSEKAETFLLANASFDATGELEIEIRTDEKIFAISDDGKFIAVNQSKKDEKTIIKLENIEPFGYVLLTSKEIV